MSRIEELAWLAKWRKEAAGVKWPNALLTLSSNSLYSWLPLLQSYVWSFVLLPAAAGEMSPNIREKGRREEKVHCLVVWVHEEAE